jgi:collagenase-like PrtC family protease
MVMKIEGRGRAPEYVDTVVKAYKSALNDIEN